MIWDWLSGLSFGMVMGMLIASRWPALVGPAGVLVIVLASLVIGATISQAIARGGGRP